MKRRARTMNVFARHAMLSALCIVAASFLWIVAIPAVAETAPDAIVPKIEPDRRDFTIGTGIVPPGSIQVEGGVAGRHGDAERSLSIGDDAAIRIPLAESFEVHVGVPSYLIRNDDRRRSGFDDASLAARWRFHHGDAVDVGVQVMSTLPTGTRRVAERRLQPQVVVASRLDLGESAELVLDLGATRASDDGRRFTQAFAAGSFRVDVGSRVNAFVEAYAFNREDAGGRSHRYVSAGAVYFASRETAMDARVGRGLRNGDGTDWLVSVGISRRF